MKVLPNIIRERRIPKVRAISFHDHTKNLDSPFLKGWNSTPGTFDLLLLESIIVSTSSLAIFAALVHSIEKELINKNKWFRELSEREVNVFSGDKLWCYWGWNVQKKQKSIMMSSRALRDYVPFYTRTFRNFLLTTSFIP